MYSNTRLQFSSSDGQVVVVMFRVQISTVIFVATSGPALQIANGVSERST